MFWDDDAMAWRVGGIAELWKVGPGGGLGSLTSFISIALDFGIA
jgi:hypothetical protein